MPKVVHLTSAHSPTDTRIFVKECRSLANAGYETVLVAPSDADEIRDGVQIRAVRNPGGGRLTRMTKMVYRVYKVALRENADLYHFHDPELTPIGIALRMRGKKVVYDVHEDLPRQVFTKSWIVPELKKFISATAEVAEAGAARVFSGIIAATPRIADRFPQRKTALVQNFPIIDELVVQSPIDYISRPNRAIYLGGISRLRGGWEMVQALDEVDYSFEVRLTLAGRFVSHSDRQIISLDSWERVDFKGWLNRKELRKELHRSRVGLVALHPTPSYVHSQPIKLFEYMAAGVPVVASDFPLWREIIESTGCGLLVDPLDPKSIGEAVEWILRHPEEAKEMGRRGREAVIERYNWKNELPSLIKLYKQLVKMPND